MANVSRQLRDVLARAESWPSELQEEAVRALLILEAEGTGPYRISDAEWADMQAGLAEAGRREFVSDADVAEANKRLGL